MAGMNAGAPVARHGPIRARREADGVLFRFDGVPTSAGPIARSMRAFVRKQGRWLRPRYGPFAVSLWANIDDRHRHIDIDNVTKASLDALNGIVWHDDRQIVALAAYKQVALPERVIVFCRLADDDLPPAPDLDDA